MKNNLKLHKTMKLTAILMAVLLLVGIVYTAYDALSWKSVEADVLSFRTELEGQTTKYFTDFWFKKAGTDNNYHEKEIPTKSQIDPQSKVKIEYKSNGDDVEIRLADSHRTILISACIIIAVIELLILTWLRKNRIAMKNQQQTLPQQPIVNNTVSGSTPYNTGVNHINGINNHNQYR